MEGVEDCEFQKMISGALYNPEWPSLFSMRAKVKRLYKEYNENVGYSEDSEKRFQHLSGIVGVLGQDPMIEPPFRVDYGINIEIGKNFYANCDVVILDCAKVTIGDNVLVGPGVHIYTPTHPLDVETRHYRKLEMARPVTIGKDVWIGGKAVVLPGVTIGEGSVIGAGSVVNKDVPPFCLAVGNPAKVIKKLEVK